MLSQRSTSVISVRGKKGEMSCFRGTLGSSLSRSSRQTCLRGGMITQRRGQEGPHAGAQIVDFIVDTPDKACKLVDTLYELPPARRKLYLDFEGINLCRDGKVCIGQLTTPKDPEGQ